MSMLWLVGGPVLWVIVACGVAGFAVYIERTLHLHRARIKTDDFLAGILNILKRGNVEEALTICKETPGPVAHLVRTAILNRNENRDVLRETVRDASLAEVSRMERRLVVISIVAQVAPLLGLLGTVLGLIDFLVVMQKEMPMVQSAHVMGAMLRALVTTAAGLMVAIPAYAAFNLLVVKIDRLVLDMERAASEMLAFLGSNGNA